MISSPQMGLSASGITLSGCASLARLKRWSGSCDPGRKVGISFALSPDRNSFDDALVTSTSMTGPYREPVYIYCDGQARRLLRTVRAVSDWLKVNQTPPGSCAVGSPSRSASHFQTFCVLLAQ